MRIRLRNIVRRCLTGLTAGLLAASMLLGSGITTYAANDVGNPTLQVIPRYGDTSLDATQYTGTFKVYKVATYNGGRTFTLTGGFAGSDINIDYGQIEDSTYVDTLRTTIVNYIGANDIAPDWSGLHSGDTLTKADGITMGLYLVAPDAADPTYSSFSPFLVMIPSYADKTTNYNVVANPKVDKPATPPGEDNPPGDTPHTSVKYGKVALGKSDAETGTPLQGVVFNLYKESSGEWVLVGTYTTDENGIVYVDNLPYGNYQFVEAQALDGYVLDTTAQGFVINAEDTVKLTMTNTKVPETPVTPEQTHGFTGDDSQMMLYGLVVVFAAAALVGWVVYKRKQNE